MTGERLISNIPKQATSMEAAGATQGMEHLHCIGLLSDYGMTTADKQLESGKVASNTFLCNIQDFSKRVNATPNIFSSTAQHAQMLEPMVKQKINLENTPKVIRIWSKKKHGHMLAC